MPHFTEVYISISSSVTNDWLLFIISIFFCFVSKIGFYTLYNPALFGPYNTRGGADLPPSFFLFS